ncbi:hypothetical protein LCGC14_1708570 [marine sediment metagenome]|uniref:Uncharacterized protein n=1 Tax=marine sediment metagenome TaxID=412755 RepID=A0A0F9JWC9_9ZZZZ
MKSQGSLWLEPIRNEVEDRWDYIVIRTKNTLTERVGAQLKEKEVSSLISRRYDVTITLPKEKVKGKVIP